MFGVVNQRNEGEEAKNKKKALEVNSTRADKVQHERTEFREFLRKICDWSKEVKGTGNVAEESNLLQEPFHHFLGFDDFDD